MEPVPKKIYFFLNPTFLRHIFPYKQQFEIIKNEDVLT